MDISAFQYRLRVGTKTFVSRVQSKHVQTVSSPCEHHQTDRKTQSRSRYKSVYHPGALTYGKACNICIKEPGAR